VVPFPYSDKLAEKRRPAIVVSAPRLSAQFGLVWLAMVTSASNRRWACDVVIGDLTTAGLPAPSLVRAAKIATVDADRIVNVIGRLTSRDARSVESQLKRLLA
jgi:mRNA interferase MazF